MNYNQVRGLWYHNLLNGTAALSVSGEDERLMVYKDNFPIDMHEGEIQGSFYCYVLFSILLVAGGVVGLIAVHPALLPVCLVIYWIYSCCCVEATDYIKNALDPD